MLTVAYDAERLRVGPEGIAHWERSARRGNSDAIAKLTPPPFPDAVDYLYDWFNELSARRPLAMHGVSPITHEGIKAWRENMDLHPEPHEVEAILRMDTVWRNALREDDEVAPAASAENGPVRITGSDRPWPAKKQQPESSEAS